MQIALPPQTRYDALSRYLVGRAGERFFTWVLRLAPDRVGFARWLPTVLALPGVPERLCDGIAELVDLEKGGRPVAALLEIQTVPDGTMPGRLLVAGGLVWLLLKPTPLTGDRYDLLAVVVNLTGIGNAERSYHLGDAQWILKPVEVNLETLDAGVVLDQVERGEAPEELLALLSLMRRGDDPAIIGRWREVVSAVSDPQRRADCALVQVFAERVGRGALWQAALEGLTMIESPIIAKLLNEAEMKATAAATAEKLLRVLQKRHESLPNDLSAAIRACTDIEQLDRWFDLALDKKTLAQFRRHAGL